MGIYLIKIYKIDFLLDYAIIMYLVELENPIFDTSFQLELQNSSISGSRNMVKPDPIFNTNIRIIKSKRNLIHYVLPDLSINPGNIDEEIDFCVIIVYDEMEYDTKETAFNLFESFDSDINLITLTKNSLNDVATSYVDYDKDLNYPDNDLNSNFPFNKFLLFKEEIKNRELSIDQTDNKKLLKNGLANESHVILSFPLLSNSDIQSINMYYDKIVVDYGTYSFIIGINFYINTIEKKNYVYLNINMYNIVESNFLYSLNKKTSQFGNIYFDNKNFFNLDFNNIDCYCEKCLYNTNLLCSNLTPEAKKYYLDIINSNLDLDNKIENSIFNIGIPVYVNKNTKILESNYENLVKPIRNKTLIYLQKVDLHDDDITIVSIYKEGLIYLNNTKKYDLNETINNVFYSIDTTILIDTNSRVLIYNYVKGKLSILKKKKKSKRSKKYKNIKYNKILYYDSKTKLSIALFLISYVTSNNIIKNNFC